MSDSFLFDPDVLIDAGAGVPEALDTITAAAQKGDIQISVVTEMELLVGCRDKDEQKTLYDFLESCGIEVVQIHSAISAEAADLMRTYQLSHNLQIPDAIIAATARQQENVLITLLSRARE